jgi:hypothetical protein
MSFKHCWRISVMALINATDDRKAEESRLTLIERYGIS